jgi:FkbM family methyltransferase
MNIYKTYNFINIKSMLDLSKSPGTIYNLGDIKVTKMIYDILINSATSVGSFNANRCNGHYQGEILLEPPFITIVNEIKKEYDNEMVNMVELGSSWGYYSLLCNSILNKKCNNILVEAIKNEMNKGMINFALNNISGSFLNARIGKESDYLKKCKNYNTNISTVTLDDIIDMFDLNIVHLLHADIQGSEVEMLEGCVKHVKKFKYVFIATHSKELHSKCADMLKKEGKDILYEFSYPNIDGDGFIIAK